MVVMVVIVVVVMMVMVVVLIMLIMVMVAIMTSFCYGRALQDGCRSDKGYTMIFLMIGDDDGAVDGDGDDANEHGDDGQVCPDNDLAHA